MAFNPKDFPINTDDIPTVEAGQLQDCPEPPCKRLWYDRACDCLITTTIALLFALALFLVLYVCTSLVVTSWLIEPDMWRR